MDMVDLIDFKNIFKQWSYDKTESRTLFDTTTDEVIVYENGVFQTKKNIVEIVLKETKLTYHVSEDNITSTLMITGKLTDNKNNGLNGKTIEINYRLINIFQFTLETKNVTTDENGEFSTTITTGTGEASRLYKITLRNILFKGDGKYKESTGVAI